MRLFKLLLLTGLLVNLTAHAQEDLSRLSDEERLERLERLVDSQGLVDILLRLENLQAEVQRLRGENEVQAHTLEEIKKRQRELYIDIDRRLLQLERQGGDEAAMPDSAPARVDSKPAVKSSGPSGAVADKPATDTGKLTEQQAYQKAFDLLRELRYDKATAAFRDFLRDYPNGRYAHIAQYWLGEANYAQRNFKAAIADYEKLISDYPNSPKVAEAMLKIGYSQYELNDLAAARKILEKLVATYPGTTEAGQAQNLLQKIRLKQSKG